MREELQKLIMLTGPSNVPLRVQRAMLKPIIDHRSKEFQELYRGIVEKAKKVFQTKNDLFVLSCSGTGAVECAISNIISKMDKVLVPVNGVFSERLKIAVEKFGECVELPVEWGKAPTIDQIKSKIEKEENLKAVAVVYSETSTGAVARCLSEIGRLCKQKGVLLVVDAIPALGGEDLPVDKWGVDICLTGSQKCLMTPPGLALLSVSERAWAAMHAMKQERYYFDLRIHREFQERYETPYTPALPLFYAIDEALRMIEQEGLETVFKRHSICAEALYSAAEAIQLEVFPANEFRSKTVIAIKNPPHIKDSDLRHLLKDKYDVVVAGGQGKLSGTMFRIGVMGAVNRSMILRTVSSLELALLELGHTLRLGAGTTGADKAFSGTLY